MISRSDRSIVGQWWWTRDRPLLFLSLVLIAFGLIVAFAGMPDRDAAERLPALAWRHGAFALLSVVVILSVSFLGERKIRRIGFLIAIVNLSLMAMVVFLSPEIKGARRWFSVGGISFQPSEFVKPAFVVLTAWLFAQRQTRPDMPATAAAMILLAVFSGLLVLQPDIGQTSLVFCVWAMMFFLANLSWAKIVAIGGIAVAAGIGVYGEFSHVARRINQFFTGSGDNYQLATAIKSFSNGGWFGIGPGEGRFKAYLPDARTDFIFAVIGEEFGIAVCMVLAMIYFIMVVRILRTAMEFDSPFHRLALAGLAFMFGFQALLNMAVSVRLIPATGLTLPFISYGGSSMTANAIIIGMALALGGKTARVRPLVPSLGTHGSFCREEKGATGVAAS